MAMMWPRTLPEWVRQDPRRKAECEVYTRLNDELPADWSVYYSRPWWGLGPKGGEIDGEADFIVAHPQMGVLFIEVKGGLVSYDPTSERWTSRDRFGVTHNIKDPMQQAVKSKYELLKKFRLSPGWPRGLVRLRHGVIFSDSQLDKDGLIGGYEKELFCFSNDLRAHLGRWVMDRLVPRPVDGFDRELEPGVEGIDAINATIASPAKLKVPLQRRLEADVDRQDMLLTGAQLQAVLLIDNYERVVVEGGAGTGKTLIACELALRYASKGFDTLLCCHSLALARSLADRIGDYSRLKILTIQEMQSLVSRGELGQFRAVIVDEGQDVDWLDWGLVERCVDTDGYLRVFFDSNQAVYRARDDIETRLQAVGISLRLNLRNTQRIASVTEPLYRGPLIQCAGAEGGRPVLIETPAPLMAERVSSTLHELVVDQALLPDDVAVLVSDDRVAEEIRLRLSREGFKCTDAVHKTSNAIVVDCVTRFKGLEALTVILMMDRRTANNVELAYVGVSRARALLVVIGPVAGTKLGDALREGGSDEVTFSGLK